MYRLHGYSGSANSYKVELLFLQLGLQLEFVEIDIAKGESHTPAFRKLNPFELTPALEDRDSGQVLVESNAILWRIAQGTPFAPTDADGEYEALKWMFFEQNLIEPNIGRARRLLLVDGVTQEEAGSALAERQAIAAAALRLMNQAIGDSRFLVGNAYGVADIALFAYTHLTADAGVSLREHANIRRWISNVRETPRFKPFAPAQEG